MPTWLLTAIALDHREDDGLDADEIGHALDMRPFDALVAIDGERRRRGEGVKGPPARRAASGGAS